MTEYSIRILIVIIIAICLLIKRGWLAPTVKTADTSMEDYVNKEFEMFSQPEQAPIRTDEVQPQFGKIQEKEVQNEQGFHIDLEELQIQDPYGDKVLQDLMRPKGE